MSTGTMGTAALRAMWAKPRENGCSRSCPGLRVPSGKMIMV